MLPHYLLLLFAIVGLLLVVFIFLAIWASRFARVGPNQVLVVSGRQARRPDGTTAGFRFVMGGGTFVLPVIEKVDVLTLEVATLELPKARRRMADGREVQAEAIAQVKINSQEAALAVAAEHFLNKTPAEVAAIARPTLEKHLSTVLAGASPELATRNPGECAALIQTAAAADLAKLGLTLVLFDLRPVSPA